MSDPHAPQLAGTPSQPAEPSGSGISVEESTAFVDAVVENLLARLRREQESATPSVPSTSGQPTSASEDTPATNPASEGERMARVAFVT